MIYLLAGLLLSSSAAAQNPSPRDIETALKREYVGTNRLIRGFYGGEELRFGEDGSPISAGPAEPWTVATVHIEKLDLRKHAIRIRGRRTLLLFDRQARTFKPSDRYVLRGDNLRKISVAIEVAISNERDEATIRNALEKVFVAPQEDFSSLVPDYWKEFVQRFSSAKPADDSPTPKAAMRELPDGTKAYRVGNGTKAPRVVRMPDPEYSEAARRAKISGTTIIRMVVSEKGVPTHLAIVTPLGAGLDEKAIKAVEQWSFQPGEKDGQPVAVMVNVEISFRLY